MKSKPLKDKKCRVKTCKKLFTPRNSMQVVCPNYQCAIDYVLQKKAEKIKKEHNQVKREANDNSLKHVKRRARDTCHRFIRFRDAQLGCITCGTTTAEIYDAGHYKSRGANSELMFHHWNIHKQCRKCNYYAGSDPRYRQNLIGRIGIDAVEYLERKDHKHYVYTIDDYHQIREWFADQYRALQLVR